MNLITKSLPDSHNIFHFGDVHYGSVLSAKTGWNKLVDMMCSEFDGCKNNYGIDGGDTMEAILVDDKRFSSEKFEEPLPIIQMEDVIKQRQPIKHMLLTMLMGNHERKLWKFGDITQKICKELNVPYGTYSSKITIKTEKGQLMYKIYETHGSKGISSTADDPIRRYANMELILKRHLRNKAADCAVMIKHHAHKLISCKPRSELYLIDDGKKIKQGYTGWGENESYIHPDARWYGCAGSFLRLFGEGISGYAEIAEYDPVELGFLVTKVRDRKIVELKPVFLNI
jgi:hypothetical protein